MMKNTIVNAAAAICLCACATTRADLLKDICDADRRAGAVSTFAVFTNLTTRLGFANPSWHFHCDGPHGLAEQQLFSGVDFTERPPSWTEMVTNPDPSHDSFAIGVWGALEEYDRTDLV